jgi:hypothetical protein
VQHDRAHILLGVEEEDPPRDVVVLRAVRKPVQPVVDADRGAGLRLVLGVDRGRRSWPTRTASSRTGRFAASMRATSSERTFALSALPSTIVALIAKPPRR